MLLAIATCCEFYADMFIFWIPFYYELKLSFFLWLAYSRGSDILYERVLRPRLTVHEKSIDTALEQVKFQILHQAVLIGKNAMIWSQQKIVMIMAEGQMFAMKQMFAKASSEQTTTATESTPILSSVTPKDVPEKGNKMEANPQSLYPNLTNMKQSEKNPQQKDEKEEEEQALIKEQIDQFEILQKEEMDNEELVPEKIKKPSNDKKKNPEKNQEKSAEKSGEKGTIPKGVRRNTAPNPPPLKLPTTTTTTSTTTTETKLLPRRKTVAKEH